MAKISRFRTFITAALLSLTALICCLSLIIVILMVLPVQWLPESSLLVVGIAIRNIASFLWNIQLFLAPIIIISISMLIITETFILASDFFRRLKREK